MINHWTDEEIIILKDLMGKMSFKAMEKHFNGHTGSALLHKVQNLGLSNGNYHFCKHFFDVDFLRIFPIFKLDRKWNNPKILEIINKYKQKRPAFFQLAPELQEIKDRLLSKTPY